MRPGEAGDTTRSGRDTALSGVASAIGLVVLERYEVSSTEAWLLSVAAAGVLTFGWRFLRRYAPWATRDDAGA